MNIDADIHEKQYIDIHTHTHMHNHTDSSEDPSLNLAQLIERSRTDKDAQKAVAEAKLAAAHNKALLDSARNILHQSAVTLGKDAVALPSPDDGALPSPFASKGNGKTAVAQRRDGAREVAVNRQFVHATRFAREY
jgi:hypothetical protein